MMKYIEHAEEIFNILKDELSNISTPIIAREKWGKIAHTPFNTLISCILSLRTKDQVTEKASFRLLKKYNTPEKLIQLTEKQLQNLIYPVGFYKTKARRIKELSRELIENHNGQVPNDFEELLKFKGIGRNIGNCG